MMKKIFYLLHVSSLLLHHPGYAQKKGQDFIDSLHTELKRANKDTAKVNSYAQLMLAHVYYKPEEGIALSKEALALTQILNWKPGEAKIKHRMARLYWRMGRFEEAITYHNQALELYKQIGNKHGEGLVLIETGQDYLDNGKLDAANLALQKALQFNEAAGDLNNMATAYNILCYLYDVQGNSAAATQAAYDYLKLSEKIGDKSAIGHSAHMLASNYLALGNNTEALKYFKQGLQLSKETGNQIDQVNCNISIGGIYLAEKNFSESFHYYATALKITEDLGDTQMLAYMYHRMGHYYRTMDNFSKTLHYYLSSETAYKSISNKQDLAGLYADIATAYTNVKNYEQAEKYFIRSKNLYDGLNSKMSMVEYYHGKQKFDSATGNWQSAYQHYKEYTAIRDSSVTKESLQKLVGSQLQYDNEKKEALSKAEQEKKDLVTQAAIKRQRNILYAAFAVIVLVLLFSLVVFRQRNKIALEKKRSDQLVKDKELLLREIHHRVKNNLEVVSSLLALQSAQIGDAGTREAMQEGQNRVQSIGIVHQKLYQGTNLGAIEMKDYFINLSDSILDSFGAEGRVTVACAMEKLEVDIDTAVPLGLIVNELLTNTLKYAFPDGGKGHVTIKLEKTTPGILQLEVSDDGVGKSGITKGTGFGGQLVALLTQQLDGVMREVVENGTRVFFEFKDVVKRVA
ncbi:MAG: tetratricopeptide repeat protein [Bacteroidota bacterium]